MNDVMMQ